MDRFGAFVFAYHRERELYFAQLRSENVGNPLTWAIPGGGVEPNEGLREAAQREFYEEVGVEPPFNELAFTGLMGHQALFLWMVDGLFEGPRNQEAAAHVWLPLDFLPTESAPWFPKLYIAAGAAI